MDLTQHSLFEQIERAAATIAGQVPCTPCSHSRILSQLFGAEIFLKFENLQFTSSFKERGALNKLLSLSPEQRKGGVIAISAGNHAQGVAYHAQRLGISAVIVMPQGTPTVKVESTRHFGPEIVLHGDTFDAAMTHGFALAKQRGLTMVHPYDDPLIVAGQGTVGLEMLRQQPDLNVLVVPIGGGGLISGIAVAAKQRKREIEVIGVQTECFPHMVNAIKGTSHPSCNLTIAEGIAVKSRSELTHALVRQYVDDVVLVSEGDIEHAILRLLEIEKTLVEGAAAASLAAVEKYTERFRGKRVGLVLSGGNLDPLMLADVIKRGMVRAGRLTRVCVDIRDVPGALSAITGIVAKLNANIEDVVHQRAFTALPIKNAELDMVLQTRNVEHVEEVLAALNAAGFHARLHNQ
jgi:threonine dehydratase